MINKIKLLGEYVQDDNGQSNPLNLKTNLLGAYVIFLQFYYDGETCEYEGTDTIQEYTRDNMEKFMFAVTPSPRSTPLFPSWSIGNSISTSLDQIKKSLKEKCNLGKIASTIQLYEEEIINNITQAMDRDASNHVLTVQINKKFIKDSEYFNYYITEYRENIEQSHYYMASGNVTSKGQALCYFCKNEKTVYGFVNLNDFSFYSANEQAYIAGGFQKNSTWKNYPVCSDCLKPLQAGKMLIENHFHHKFWGNDYFILPTPILARVDFSNLLEDMKEEYRQISLKRGDDAQSQRSKELEEDILQCLARQNDNAAITFFFFKKDKKKFQILQEAEDILPSRFHQIIEAKKFVEDFDEFKDLVKDKEKKYHHLRFNFGTIRTFFDKEFNKDFLAIVARIFKNKLISKQVVLHRISVYLAEKFRQERMYYDFFRAMQFMKFLYKLNLIYNEPLKKEIQMDGIYESYFNKHPDFFDADIKKAVFLEGLLVQKLLNIQHQERGSIPFRSRLNGLKIDVHVVHRLLPEAIEKLEQYKKNYYRDLESQISTYLISGDPDLKKMSVDEISFFFTMGMNLAKTFKHKEEEKEGEDNE